MHCCKVGVLDYLFSNNVLNQLSRPVSLVSSSAASGECDGRSVVSCTMSDPLDSVGQGDTWYGYNLVSGCCLLAC